MKVHIATFGCQMNKLDSELLGAELSRAGFELTDDPSEARVHLFNTCSVRAHAEDRVASRLGALARVVERDPGVIVGVIGCMAQRVASELARRFPHVRLLCGPGQFLEVPDFLRRLIEGDERVVALDNLRAPRFQRDESLRADGPHAWVSIMRGCNNYCAYCVVPYLRGPESSRPPGQIVDEVRRLADDGVIEVTLLGQNVNSYGFGLRPAVSLADLLAELDRIEALRRIRFVTSHPRDMSEAILRAVASLDKVCEHIHMPAQAGSDRILAKMGRGYTAARYLELVAAARAIVPGVEIASDFIVGFPGETESDFADTLRLVERAGFQQCFMFKFSPRPGTQAARWPDDVPAEVKSERLQRLIAAQRRVGEARHRAMVGGRFEVLVTGPSKSDPAHAAGRTRGNDIVVVPVESVRAGELATVEITGHTDLTLFGRKVTPA